MKANIVRDLNGIFECDFSNYEPEVEILAHIKKHDEYTYLHCLNVAKLSVSLGRRLGFPESEVVDIGWAALLHDVGKLNIPSSILNKIHRFTPDELNVMQSHPMEALTAFASHSSVTLARLNRLSAAFEHHQRYDLKGYPTVQKKLTLHPYSRIVSVADTFDAMTTDRIYQRRVLPDVALKIMAQGFGTIFDPVVLQAFITGMGVYPVGSVVRMNTDELAVVIHYQPESALDRPEVFFFAADRQKLIDLMAPENQSLRIIRSEPAEDHDIVVEDILKQAERLRKRA